MLHARRFSDSAVVQNEEDEEEEEEDDDGDEGLERKARASVARATA